MALIRRVSGVVLVVVGVYLALQVHMGAALFAGLALLAVGCWLFLGSLASFGSRNHGEPWDAGSGGGESGGNGDGN